MTFAKWVFTLAGLYGLITVPPDYFLEGVMVRRYGPLGQPLWLYGFLGLVVVFQLIYLQIGRDPPRYRAFMPLALLGKLSFATTAVLLHLAGRTPTEQVLITAPDMVWCALFAIAWLRTPKT